MQERNFLVTKEGNWYTILAEKHTGTVNQKIHYQSDWQRWNWFFRERGVV